LEVRQDTNVQIERGHFGSIISIFGIL